MCIFSKKSCRPVHTGMSMVLAGQFNFDNSYHSLAAIFIVDRDKSMFMNNVLINSP